MLPISRRTLCTVLLGACLLSLTACALGPKPGESGLPDGVAGPPRPAGLPSPAPGPQPQAPAPVAADRGLAAGVPVFPWSEAPSGERPRAVDAGFITEMNGPARGRRALRLANRALEIGDRGGPFTLAFRQGPIRQLAEVIVIDLLGMNLIADPSVTGDVSVEVSEPMGGQELLQFLRSAAEAHGASLDTIPGGFHLRPHRGGPGEMVEEVRAIGLQYSPAEQVRAALADALPAGVRIGAAEGSSHIVLAGAAYEVDRVAQLIYSLDTEALAGRMFGLFPVRSAAAADIAKEMNAIYEAMPGIRVTHLERLNALLVVTREDTLLEDARRWIVQLDRTHAAGARRIYTYRPIAGQAARLAELIAPLIDARIARRESEGSGFGGGLEVPRAGVENRLIAPVGDISLETEGETPGPAAGPESARTANVPYLLPDARTNQIILYVNGRQWETVQDLLAELDRRPPQIMIEATIVEVTLTDELRYGLRYLFENGEVTLDLFRNAFQQAITQTAGLDLSFTGSNLQATLDALSSVTRLKVVSSPKLMVVNSETAILQIGDQVPVATQSAIPTEAAGGRIVNTIEFRDTGVILRITPQVSGDGIISLALEQEVSDVIPTTTSEIESPTIRQRRVKSAVDLRSGQTIAMAGLTREVKDETETGIPVLRDMPVFGPLFGASETISEQSELVIFLTPRIVRQPQEALALSSEISRKLETMMESFEDEES